MESVLTSLPNLKIREKIRDDDFVDQMHHFVTVYMFALFGLIIGLKEYMGSPLDCWQETVTWQHFQGHTNTYCWSHKLHRFPDVQNLSKVPYLLSEVHGGPLNATEAENSSDMEINFYRWITVIFIIQAFMFKVPNLFWSECNEYSGTQIEKMVKMISDSSFKSRHEKDELFSSVAEYLETWLKINRKPFWFMKSRVGRQTKQVLQHCMLCVGANTGNYLSSMYLVTKFLFLLNTIVQFMFLSAFLDFNYWPYGPKAVQHYQESKHPAIHVHFPRMALCHFQILGKGQWVQCLLTINMLLEKIFVVEWFWLIFLLGLTLYSFISWGSKILRTVHSVKFVSKYLSVFNEDGTIPQDGHRTVHTFVRDYLGNDGIFLLRILATNTNDVVMSEMVCSVWQRYINFQYKVVATDAEELKPSLKKVESSDDLEMEELKPEVVVGPAGDRASPAKQHTPDPHHIA